MCDHESELPDYEDERHQQFVKDMRAAGIPVRDYHGRFYYHGPAAVTNDEFDEQDIYSATKVKLTRDNLGLGLILYPH